jgi:protein TonB
MDPKRFSKLEEAIMDFSQGEGNQFRRYSGLSIVILLHILIAYVVLTDHARKAIDVIKEPVVTEIIAEVTPPPPPEIQIQQPQEVIAEVSVVQPTGPAVDSAPSSIALAGTGEAPPVPGFVNLNGCKPEYPRASLLAEEAGTVRVQFDVSADAHLAGAKIIRSSGYKSPDKAAVSALRRCKFRAAYQNGIAVQSSFLSDYVWKLK